MKGKIKQFKPEKGYGFINAEGSDKDIFFHFSELVMDGYKTIEPGAEVEFELVETERGSQAKKVVKL